LRWSLVKGHNKRSAIVNIAEAAAIVELCIAQRDAGLPLDIMERLLAHVSLLRAGCDG
jgi:hypothetical protein